MSSTEARRWWKEFYRLWRIARRESAKAQIDLCLYGTSCVLIKENGEAERVHPSEIEFESMPQMRR